MAKKKKFRPKHAGKAKKPVQKSKKTRKISKKDILKKSVLHMMPSRIKCKHKRF